MIIIARKSKCKGENCGKILKPEEKQVLNSKSYCTECYIILSEEKQKEKENKKKERLGNSSKDKSQYEQLISTICEYFNIDKPTGLIMKQIKQYKDEYGYTDSGIGYTLWYLKEIENKRFDESKYGIALVKYNYENAKLYFEQQERTRKSVDNIVPNENVRVVKVNIGNMGNRTDGKKFIFDLDKMIGGDK